MTANPSRVAVTVPDLGVEGETIKVSAWLVDVGQTVIAGERIVEVLLPGMTFDIAAPQTGELVEIASPVDSAVASGDVLAWVDCR